MKRGKCWFCKRTRPLKRLFPGGIDHPGMECRGLCHAAQRRMYNRTARRRQSRVAAWSGTLRSILRMRLQAPKWRGVYR